MGWGWVTDRLQPPQEGKKRLQNCSAGQDLPAAVMVVTNVAKMTPKPLYFGA